MRTDQEVMAQALELAKRAAELGEVPVGAVLVLDGEVIGVGHNQPIASHDPTAHAEIQALRAGALNVGNYRLPEATLFVTLEPCMMCAGAMVHARIKRLVYGASDPKTGAIDSMAKLLDQSFLNHRIDYQGGVLAEACGVVLSEFFRQRRR